ncbi:MAG: hypothetical protein O2816_08340 [Planctomycetota bacterium]|nr:hypothetical protein [Planctomycetota bacterium]
MSQVGVIHVVAAAVKLGFGHSDVNPGRRRRGVAPYKQSTRFSFARGWTTCARASIDSRRC